MKLKPLADNVLIKPSQEDKVTTSGIVLPDTTEKEGLKEGEVVAIGPGKMLENGNRSPMSVKVGDKVLLKKYGPDEVKIGSTDYLVAEENDIIAVVE